jgi:hypothetical protein
MGRDFRVVEDQAGVTVGFTPSFDQLRLPERR